MTQLETFLGTLVLILIISLVIAIRAAASFYRKSQRRQTKAYEAGKVLTKGEVYQSLGTFSLLGDYDQIITLSTTSQQASLDLIGVKSDVIEFIEFKKKGALLSSSERNIKRLIDSGKVKYTIKDVDIQPELNVTDR